MRSRHRWRLWDVEKLGSSLSGALGIKKWLTRMQEFNRLRGPDQHCACLGAITHGKRPDENDGVISPTSDFI